MNSGAHCKECGAAIPAGTPAGLCGKCLLALGLGQTQDTLAAAAAGITPASAIGDPSSSSTNPDLEPTAVVADPPTEKAGDKIGRYKLLQQIGEGGMGVVYMAEQQEPVVRKVALKIIKVGMDTRQVVARFEAERQALALMDHPNIARVLDAGATESRRPYFVMELVQGVPITRFCDEAQLDTTQRLDLFGQVCSAVQHAHQKGVIHRDIKPSNVLVTLVADQPVPKVIDFGIAKSTQQRLTEKTLFTQFQQFIGTPAYMSPEQAGLSGLDIDTRSDIYALGVLLYELLTGRTPFDTNALLRAGYDEILRVIKQVDPAKPSTRLSTMKGPELSAVAQQRRTDPKRLGLFIRGDLDWIVMKALEKDRTRRYETANGLAADIRRFLKHEPVTAAAPSTAYKLRKFVRRNRTHVTVAAVILALLLTGISVSTCLALWAMRARKSETKARQAESQQRLRAEEGLQRMQVQKAEEMFSSGEAPLGIAYLGQVLRANPSNYVAAYRLVSALEHRRFPVVLTGPIRQDQTVRLGQFSPDGQRIMLVYGEYVPKRPGYARIWDAQNGQPIGEPLRHEDAVTSAQFSSNGQRILTASYDKTARVWDASTGRPIGAPLLHRDQVFWARFSPDGRRAVTGCGNSIEIGQTSKPGYALVWDLQTGQPIGEPLRHESNVVWVDFSPDGEKILTICLDWKVRIWDAHTGQLVGEPLSDGNCISSAEFSPDGQRLVTRCDSASAVRIWDTHTWNPVGTPLRHDGRVNSAGFSPDGQRVITADGMARIWDATTSLQIGRPLKLEGLGITHAEFNPNSQSVLAGAFQKTAHLLDASTGQQIIEPLRHESSLLFAPQFSPGGQRILTTCGEPNGSGSFQGAMQIWDASLGHSLALLLRHKGQVRSAQFSPDGKWILTAADDGIACIWDAQTGRRVGEPIIHDVYINFAQFSPDGQRIVTASGSTARVWDARTGQPLTGPLHHGLLPREQASGATIADLQIGVWSAEFSPDGQRILTASADKSARIWDARTGMLLVEPLRHDDAVICAQFSRDGQRVVTASFDKTARVWDARTGQPITAPLRHEREVTSASFSPDGQRIVTASGDKTARVWDARTGQPLTDPLHHEGGIASAQFSPDGERIVTASNDQTARVWDAHTGQAMIEPLRHDSWVTLARFSPDGKRILTASWNKLRLWDAHSGLPITEQLRNNVNDEGIRSAQFSPDGRRVLAVCGQTVTVWDVPVPQLPVPAWFLEWAEAEGGRHLNPQGIAVAVPIEERRRLRNQATTRTETDSYSRTARWVQADPASRSISTTSPVTVSEFISQRIQENSLANLRQAVQATGFESWDLRWRDTALASLREGVQAAPTNASAFALMSVLVSDEDPKRNPRRLEEAEFYARHALKQDTNSSEAWWALGTVQLRKDQTTEALKSIERSLELLPVSTEAWAVKAQILEKTDHLTEALEACNRQLECTRKANSQSNMTPERAQALLARASLLKKLRRFREAGEDTCAANGISARAAEAGSNQIDLSAFYNVPLTRTWHSSVGRSDLAELTPGLHRLSGVDFDVRGIIQLNCMSTMGEPYPKEVRGIAVNRACQRVHFLHSAVNSSSRPFGTEIGYYLVHQAGGQETKIPLLIGRDLADWFNQLNEHDATFEVAWLGDNETTRALGRKIRLFKTTWQNPQPDAAVESIDFVSTHGPPFLVAITAE